MLRTKYSLPFSFFVSAKIKKSQATSVEVKLGINYIGMDTLNNWDWNFADDRVSVPWVTADGLRLAHHTGLANLSDFADKVPVSDLNELSHYLIS